MEINKAHCSICLCDIEANEKKTILECNHTYHASCITEWRETHITCPVCRLEMPLTCCEKCNVWLNLPSLRCVLEVVCALFIPSVVISIIIILVVEMGKLRK